MVIRFVFILYRTAWFFLRPLTRSLLEKRRTRGKEDPLRYAERLAFPSKARPCGKLFWFHAASVGESLSLLSLLKALRTAYPDIDILVTTGTVTSAKLLAQRLPMGCFHQYVPLDDIYYVKKFLTYWHPSIAVWVESELWPNLIWETAQRSIPLVLLNGRMSKRSYKRWRWFPFFIRPLLRCFAVCLCQTQVEVKRFKALGANNPRYVGNLKATSQTLCVKPQEYTQFESLMQARPAWVAASTHEGEEAKIITVHEQLLKKWPDLILFLVPRHPERGDEVARLIEKKKLPFAQRSHQQSFGGGISIYLADTLGELGLFYRLGSLSFIGGSFVDVGGHNPIESALLHNAILIGPSTYNFAKIVNDMQKKKAITMIEDEQGLYNKIDDFLSHPKKQAGYAKQAFLYAQEEQAFLPKVVSIFETIIASKETLQ